MSNRVVEMNFYANEILAGFGPSLIICTKYFLFYKTGLWVSKMFDSFVHKKILYIYLVLYFKSPIIL